MTDLVVRRLLIDLQAPIERHWCGADPFRTALFNALSMSFPVGEQFFIDSVRDALQALPPARQSEYAAEVKGFIGQEATHRRIHALFNDHLERQGLANGWAGRVLARLPMFRGEDPRHALAVTAANEHFTAILAEWLLGHPEMLAGSEERLSTLWLWHSAEEAEHKSTAFDLYQALGGDHHWRVRWFRRISLIFVADLTRQTLSNLHRDGTLWQWRTWRSAARHLLGRDGMVRRTFAPWRAYLRPDFHPRQLSSDLSQRWLEDHARTFRIVGAAAD